MSSLEDEQFARDGYLVVHEALSAELCATLLQEVLRTFSVSAPSYVLSGGYRIHCPLRFTAPVRQAIRTTLQHGYDMVERFLRRQKWLVELSSITVFPHAGSQPIHADEEDPDKDIVTVFINLLPTATGVGPLCVFPGSHRQPPGPDARPHALLLEAGSAVFMNGKVWHAGTDNSSVDRIRPVVYYSFGDDDIAGPTYSLRPEYRKRFGLAEFRVGALDPQCRPYYLPDCAAALTLTSDRASWRVLCLDHAEINDTIELSGDEEWIVALLKRIGPRGDNPSAEQLARELDVPPSDLLTALRRFSEAGIIAWS